MTNVLVRVNELIKYLFDPNLNFPFGVVPPRWFDKYPNSDTHCQGEVVPRRRGCDKMRF